MHISSLKNPKGSLEASETGRRSEAFFSLNSYVFGFSCETLNPCVRSLELKSLEEPRYLLGEFAKHPLACLTLASFLSTNTGDVARRHIMVRAGECNRNLLS